MSTLPGTHIAQSAKSASEMGCEAIVLDTKSATAQGIGVHMLNKDGDTITERIFAVPDTRYRFKMCVDEMFEHVKVFLNYFERDEHYQPKRISREIPILLTGFDSRFYDKVLDLGHPTFRLKGLKSTLKEAFLECERQNLMEYLNRKRQKRNIST